MQAQKTTYLGGGSCMEEMGMGNGEWNVKQASEFGIPTGELGEWERSYSKVTTIISDNKSGMALSTEPKPSQPMTKGVSHIYGDKRS